MHNQYFVWPCYKKVYSPRAAECDALQRCQAPQFCLSNHGETIHSSTSSNIYVLFEGLHLLLSAILLVQHQRAASHPGIPLSAATTLVSNTLGVIIVPLSALGTRSTLLGTSPVDTSTLTPGSNLSTRGGFDRMNLSNGSLGSGGLLGGDRLSNNGLGGGAGLGSRSFGCGCGCGSLSGRLGFG